MVKESSYKHNNNANSKSLKYEGQKGIAQWGRCHFTVFSFKFVFVWVLERESRAEFAWSTRSVETWGKIRLVTLTDNAERHELADSTVKPSLLVPRAFHWFFRHDKALGAMVSAFEAHVVPNREYNIGQVQRFTFPLESQYNTSWGK